MAFDVEDSVFVVDRYVNAESKGILNTFDNGTAGVDHF